MLNKDGLDTIKEIVEDNTEVSSEGPSCNDDSGFADDSLTQSEGDDGNVTSRSEDSMLSAIPE